jgi:energy-coupling factor transporter ATP-binding protein EcfA2
MLTPQAGRLRVSAPRAFVFQNPDHQVVMPTVGADVAFGLGRLDLSAAEVTRRVDEALAVVNLQARLMGAAAWLSCFPADAMRCNRGSASGQCTR